MRTRNLAWCALVVFAGCSSSPEVTRASFESVRYELYEHDGSEKHGIPPDLRTAVDANSDLVVDFEVATTAQADPASKEWNDLNALLKVTDDTARQYVEINKVRVDLSDPNAVTALQRRASQHDQIAIGLQQSLFDLLGPQDGQQVVLGTFDDQPSADPYANIARYLRGEIDRLSDQVQNFTKSRRRLAVSVEAFLLPRNGDPRQLHVENYDSIPAGKYQPIDRFGLSLTDAEQKDLNMQIAQAEQAATVVREILDSKGKIDEAIQELIRKLEAAADKFVAELRKGSSGTWRDTLRNAETALRAGAADPAFASVRVQLAALADHLQQLQTDVAGIAAVVESVRALSKAPARLDELVAAAGGIIDRVQNITDRLKAWKDTDGPDALRQIADIKQGVADVDFKRLVPPPIHDFLDRLADDIFPNTWAFVVEIVGMIKKNRDTQTALDELAGQDNRLIFRELDDLKQARIELPRAGLVLGDRVQPRITFYNVGSDGKRQDAVHTERYDTEAELMGLHRKLGAQLIFARASSGTDEARDWRPNVAVSGEYHYLIRDPDGFVAHAWNAVDLGAGLHVASLDQGSDTVELGLGVQASILGGLITGGYGWNLSVDRDRDYYYVGVDLFDLLLDSTNLQVGAR